MPTPTEDLASLALPRHTKVLLVMDVVESVRLMEQDEDGFVRRWQQLVSQVETSVLPSLGGRIVKSLGDGLMLEFDDAASFSRAALAIQAACRALNEPVEPALRMQLRIGAHEAEFSRDRHDIYGAGVNLTARITTLAGPGEIVISAELRDRLTDGLDASLEDLGDCHLKHVAQPVRAYRLGTAGPAPVLTPLAQQAPLKAAIAVIPFEARSNEPEFFAIGELIADGVIAQLGRTAELRVISRLSSSAFRARDAALTDVARTLGVSYVLSGSYVASSGRLLVMSELSDARDGTVVWSERLSGEVGDLLQAESELGHRLASATHDAVLRTEVQRTLLRPLPTLESCSLLLSGISLTHRASSRDFDRGRQALDALVERHPRAAPPRAWLAKWYILKVMRGMSDLPERDARRAIELTERALDAEPDSALAMAIHGHALCQLSSDAQGSLGRIDEAIALSPNEPLAWLYKSVWSSMWGSTQASVDEALKASVLSPIDPMKYYYDLILATGLSIDGDHVQAIEFARRSHKANRHHQPTLRVLMYSHAQLGQEEQARAALRLLQEQNPNLTVSSYLGMGSGQSHTRQKVAAVMRRLGVPE